MYRIPTNGSDLSINAATPVFAHTVKAFLSKASAIIDTLFENKTWQGVFEVVDVSYGGIR
jgi:hypothetical protein